MFYYTTCFATYLIDQNYKVRERIDFKENTIKYNELLKERKEILIESKLLSRFKNIKRLKDKSKIKEIISKDKKLFKSCNVTLTQYDIKNSVGKDNLIIQAVDSIEELQKTINMLTKRLREWYSFYFPELDNRLEDNAAFVNCVLKTKKENIKELKINDKMGSDFEKADITATHSLANSINRLIDEQKNLETYLHTLMKKECPNITAVTGPMIGAKLIAIAGSLKKIVLFPTSTIQLLGAEKALFRHLKNKKSLPPKYGLIFQHQYIQKAKQEDRGKVARLLSDKISMAAKIDYFKGKYLGDKLKKELEEKIDRLH